MALLDTLTAQPLPLHVDADGMVRIGGTRVTLDTVIGEYEDGANVEEIAQNYDTLNPADIHMVIGYYLKHQAEVTAYLEQNRRRAEEVRKENEARFPSHGLRERLLSRRNRKP